LHALCQEPTACNSLWCTSHAFHMLQSQKITWRTSRLGSSLRSPGPTCYTATSVMRCASLDITQSCYPQVQRASRGRLCLDICCHTAAHSHAP
jgi:hypothetical protein